MGALIWLFLRMGVRLNCFEMRVIHGGRDWLRLGWIEPNGIGVQVRFRFGEHWGPLQEVVSGSGYLSQNQPRLFSGELNGQRPVGIECCLSVVSDDTSSGHRVAAERG